MGHPNCNLVQKGNSYKSHIPWLIEAELHIWVSLRPSYTYGCHRGRVTHMGVIEAEWQIWVSSRPSDTYGCQSRPSHAYGCHRGRVTHMGVIVAEWHIWVSVNKTITVFGHIRIVRRQALIWTNALLLLIRYLGANFNENLFKGQPFSCKVMLIWTPTYCLTTTYCLWNPRVLFLLLNNRVIFFTKYNFIFEYYSI